MSGERGPTGLLADPERPQDDGDRGRAPASSAPKRPARPLLLTIVASVMVGAALGGAAILVVGRSKPAPVQATPPVCAAVGCSELGGTEAPDFTLTDQDGRTVSLASLRGRSVVVEFMDPVCTDICPIVSQEFLQADRTLGADASKAVFVAVNVNQYQESVDAVRSFSQKQGLDTLPNWHFVTGSTPALRAVWRAWRVTVVPNPDGDVVHTSVVYFIDPAGRLRFVAFPDDSKAQIDLWGRTIASTVRELTGPAS
jgi:cytochrome oxidase Cu insertion factor (SCO1/SenC/PrrC family)